MQHLVSLARFGIRTYKTKLRHLQIIREKKAWKKRTNIGERALFTVYQVPEVLEEEVKIIKKIRVKSGPQIIDSSNIERNVGHEEF